MAIASLSGMTEFQYVVLLVKLVGILVSGLVSLGIFGYTTFRVLKFVWTAFMTHVKASFSGTFCTPREMEECKVEKEKQLRDAIDTLTKIVVDGFARGEKRMDAHARAQAHTTKRIDSLFVALANEQVPQEPPPSESDAHLPFFDLPEESCSDDPA